jgi:hypothetical protein
VEAERHPLDVREDPVPEIGFGPVRQFESEVTP